MLRGLYVAASGMITETNRTDVIANNLANAASSGYKRDEAINEEFAPILLKRINDAQDDEVTSFRGFRLEQGPPRVGKLGLGACTAEIATDHVQGAMKTTGNMLDLAVAGEGYFAIQTPQGVRYTRDGSFYRQANGALVTARGQAVLNAQNRPIMLPDSTTISIGAKGEIMDGARRIDTLQFVQFDDRRAVLKQGDNLYRPQEGATPQAATGDIQQGMLENSNVNIASEMVSLINNYRIYEAGSRALVTQDSMTDKVVNEVGRAT